LAAIGLAFVFQAVDLAIKNLAIRHAAAIPLMYLTALLPLLSGFGILLFGGINLGFRRLAPTAR